MTEIIDDNPTNWLIMTPDGSTETRTKDSNLNKLLFGHGLFGLLDTGEEIWSRSASDGEPSVKIIPDENAECYTLDIGDVPNLGLGAHHKTDLIGAMTEMYEERDGDTVAPLLELYDTIRNDMIRPEILRPFLNAFSDKVEERDDGWLINGHLLLGYEGGFYHPSTNSRKRSGSSVISDGSDITAYSINVNPLTEEINRQITIDGQERRLTDKEVLFLARCLWGIENTPDRREK